MVVHVQPYLGWSSCLMFDGSKPPPRCHVAQDPDAKDVAQDTGRNAPTEPNLPEEVDIWQRIFLYPDAIGLESEHVQDSSDPWP